ncbi:MAG: tetratricopeptide repeat protein [Anaerolineales bacterium]|nr:tetratricopeptide repeat protein [Anaerolineales bacterium]
MQSTLAQQIEDLRRAIEAQESLRPMLGADVVEAALSVLRQKLIELERRQAEEKNRERRKMVTVMVADVSGFTALAEKMGDEEVSEYMNRVWARVDAIIQAHGGHIEKHMGDNVVALWGLLTVREDDSEQAVRAALEIQQELPRLPLECPCQMHIAIHSGPVLLGEVGTTHEFTAIGRTVQIASLLEAEARPGEVVISHDTFRLVRGLFEVEPRSELPVSGYERPLPVYRVLRARPYAFRPRTRGVEGIETRLIGRETELRALQDTLREVLSEGKARMVTIMGEAGIGKSRLLYEFETWLSPRDRSFWILQARAVERAASMPYTLLRDAVMLRLNIPADAPLTMARQKMERAVQALLPEDPAAPEKAHFIGHLLGLDFSATPALSGILADPGQIRDRARHALAQVIAAVAARQPVILLLEDLHWADEASLDLLAYLMREVRALPVLLLVTARPGLLERFPDWWERLPGQQQLHLSPLTPIDSRALLREILQKAACVPPALEELVIAGAEGNPFYLEELVRMLIEEGVISTGDIWQIDEARLPQARVPATLTGILQARLDSLPEAERTVLQAASVFGRVFWDGALIALTGADPDWLTCTLESLEMRELIFLRPYSAFSGQREYVFKHALLRQTAHESLSKRQRRQYHLSAGEWLAAHSGERVLEYAALVAGHFETAEDWSRAALWYGQAARQAYETYAPESAVEYGRKALQFARLVNIPEAERMDWQETLGKALFALARYDEALHAYQEMRAIADAAASVEGWARAWYHIAYVHDHLGNNALSLESAENALRLADKGAKPDLLIRAVYGKGWALYRLGDVNSAIHLGELALRMARNLEHKITAQREMAQACQLLGAAYELRGEFTKAAQYEQRALELYRALRDRRGEAAMLNNQGVGAFVRGDYQTALRRYEEALRVAREIGSHERVTVFLSNLGGVRAALGQFEAAETDLRQVIERVGAAKTHYLPLTYVFLAEALLGQGRYEEACDAAQTGLRLAQESEQPDVVSAAFRVLGNCVARVSGQEPSLLNLQSPEAYYRQSIRTAEEIGADADKARALRDWALFETRRGNYDQAAVLRAEALALFRKLGMDLEVQRMETYD